MRLEVKAWTLIFDECRCIATSSNSSKPDGLLDLSYTSR